MMAAPAGNDIPFDDALCEQGRNFNNKIWNAFRLVKGWEVSDTIAQPESAKIAVEWFAAQLNKTVAEMDDSFNKYRLSEAMMAAYKLFWDEFSSWYLEMVKPAYQQPIDKATYEATLGFFDALLRILHPFMPFITEELWQALEPREEGESIMVALQPAVGEVNEKLLSAFEKVKEVIGGVRTVRLQKNIPNKDSLELQILGEHDDAFNSIITKMCNLSSIENIEEKAAGAASFLVGTTEYAVPLGNMINVEEEIAKLEADLKYQEGFLNSVLKKLSNESFVNKAPAKVIEMERKKQADAESKIKSIQESIAALKG
jgi:valyl-tRNA synthetase